MNSVTKKIESIKKCFLAEFTDSENRPCVSYDKDDLFNRLDEIDSVIEEHENYLEQLEERLSNSR